VDLNSLAVLIRICNPYKLHPDLHPLDCRTKPMHPMPTWPLPPRRRTVTLELPVEHVQHLDEQAQYIGCSRAAYLRRLIRRDMDRQGPAIAQA
jgi:hypothetical protein